MDPLPIPRGFLWQGRLGVASLPVGDEVTGNSSNGVSPYWRARLEKIQHAVVTGSD